MKERKPTVDLGYPTEPHGRIPAFANVEEEAAFWDTHDFTDFLDESVPVEITVGDHLADRLTVRLDQADRRELARRARSLGIGPSTLARMWLKERLRQETTAEGSAASIT
ncbi:MAG: CopG family antitoxin [Thermomicrobiales bacterium]